MNFSMHFYMTMATLPMLVQPATLIGATKESYVFVGTYTGGQSKGIYRYTLNHETGSLDQQTLAAETPSPSFLAIHPNYRYLYAANEVGEFAGKKTGTVSSFSLDTKSGKLTHINTQASAGSGPCHLVVDKTGRNVLVANYGAGTVAVLPILADGALSPVSSSIQHQGSSVNKQRQEAPHAHSINLDPSNRFAFAADLGLDKILIYNFDVSKGMLTPNDPPDISVAPGAGPRHFSFHPSGKFAYVINELSSTVTAFSFNPNKGALSEIQTISTLENPVNGNSTAEIQIHPSGRYLYGSNRGHNSIAMYKIDMRKGSLEHLGNEPTKGKIPRNFAIEPSGKYLLAANQDSETICVFLIDPGTGKLKPIGNPIPTPRPVCIRFVAKR